MSRFKLAVGAVALAVLTGLLGLTNPSTAHADEAWSPSPPVVQDRCGTGQDKYYLYEEDDVISLNDKEEYLPQGVWLSTNGAASVVVVARSYSGQEVSFLITFGTELDSSCVEKADTVSTRLVQCSTRNSGTDVEFIYTNTDDLSDRSRTDPNLLVWRWDGDRSAYIQFRYGQVADGESVTVTGGGDSSAENVAVELYLLPGTYGLTLETKQGGRTVLRNRLFVPACNGVRPPEGDPMGGPIPGTPGAKKNRPKASIGKCRAHKVPSFLNSRKATKLTRYKVVVNPKKGKTKRITYKVAAGSSKRVVLRKQKTGTLVKIVFAGKTVTRKLRC